MLTLTCVLYYRDFIAAADCGRQVEAHVDTAIEKAGETSKRLPDLRQKSLQFEQTSQVHSVFSLHFIRSGTRLFNDLILYIGTVATEKTAFARPQQTYFPLGDSGAATACGECC